MARNPNHERIAAVYQAVRCYPGERPGFIARLLGLHGSQVARLLPALEEHGYFLSEDERGGLWPFKRTAP